MCLLFCFFYSEFYENDDGYYFDTLSPPKVGDVCCAQFSEDGYWYRAEVTAVEGTWLCGLKLCHLHESVVVSCIQAGLKLITTMSI